MHRFVCALGCALTLSGAAFASEPASVQVPLDAATLATLPRQDVEAKVHDVALHCEGVSLIDLLRKAGAAPEGPLRGAQLSRVVMVSARDGYRVAFALAELDPSLGSRRVFVVDRCAGAPLDEEDGPIRLLVPDDTRAARSVRQVNAIRVDDAR